MKSKNKKRVIALAVSMLLLLICFVSATLAYFTDQESRTNTLTVGNVDIELYESQNSYSLAEGQTTLTADEITKVKAENEDYQDWLAENGKDIVPTVTVAKNTYIENTGKNAAYVRFVVTAPIGFKDVVTNAPEGYSKDAVILTFNETEYDDVVVSYTNDHIVYTLVRKEVLKPGEMTGNGLVEVTLNPYMTTAQLNALIANGTIDAENDDAFDIVVRADAIQTVGLDTTTKAFEVFDGTITG